MKALLHLIRPKHWAKNAFVLMPLFFGGELTDAPAVVDALLAFCAYSFAASSIYCFNDIIDVAADRRHPVKCHRPIASGAVSVAGGYCIMTLMAVLAAVAVAAVGERWQSLAVVIAAYYVLDISYCCSLKRYAIIDVVVLAIGFVLRVLAGSAATAIVPSQWIVLMTFLLTLLMGLAKRRDDVVRFTETGIAPRHNTKRYNLTFINQAVTVTASVTLVCYIMYTISPEVVARTRCPYLYLTTVFVLLGLLRYMQLTAVDGKGGDPVRLLYIDRFLQLTLAAWVLAFLVVLYML